MDEQRILDVEHLSVTLGGEKILKDVSFSLNHGKILTVVGPNGAGKTTLFRALLGLITYEGEIHWHGTQRIGYVPQRFEIDRTFPITVEEFFLSKMKDSFWFPPPGAYGYIKEFLSLVGAEASIRKTLGMLSSGELQRVLIAYALLQEPSVLFFDEPTSGIDITGGKTVYKVLQDLRDQKKLAIILITHDFSVVAQYADEVLCLNKQAFCLGVPAHVLTPETLQKVYGREIGLFEHKHQ